MRIYNLCIALLVFLFLLSCDDSFDINDEWSDITIIHGVLNQEDSVHYIKINKAFLGDASAYEMAKEADSIQYAEEVIVQLVEYVIIDPSYSPYDPYNWELSNRAPISLQRTNEIPKDELSSDGEEGIFGTEVNYLYKTDENLNGLYKYVLEVTVPGKGELISSETILINNLVVSYPPPNQPNFLVHLEGYRNPVATKWKTATYGKIFEHVLRFHYEEIVDDVTTNKYIDIKYISQIADNIRMPNEYEGVEMSQIVGGADFFANVGEKIEVKTGARRIALGLEFLFYVGGNNLNTYIAISGSAGGYGQSQPEYSNIINGTGIFAARYTFDISANLSDQSKDSLAYGYYTKDLNFANYLGQ